MLADAAMTRTRPTRSGSWWSHCCHRNAADVGGGARSHIPAARFATWKADGTVDRIHDRLRDAVRDEAGRDPMASAGVVDSQSVKGADTVGADSRGYDAGNHAGRVVMPGVLAGAAGAAAQVGWRP